MWFLLFSNISLKFHIVFIFKIFTCEQNQIFFSQLFCLLTSLFRDDWKLFFFFVLTSEPEKEVLCTVLIEALNISASAGRENSACFLSTYISSTKKYQGRTEPYCIYRPENNRHQEGSNANWLGDEKQHCCTKCHSYPEEDRNQRRKCACMEKNGRAEKRIFGDSVFHHKTDPEDQFLGSYR